MSTPACAHGVVSGQCNDCLATTLATESAMLAELRQAEPTAAIPARILARVAAAVGALRAWHDAILQARRMEAVAHQPGRYEWDLRYGEAGAGLRASSDLAEHTLAQFEAAAGAKGIDPPTIYASLGGTPARLAEGPQVHAWQPHTTEARRQP